MKISYSFLGLLFLASCYSENEEDLFPPEMPITEITVVSFSVDVNPIIQANCATSGCHVPRGIGPGTYESYAKIKAAVDNPNNNKSLGNRVVVQMDMPQSGPLPQSQINIIKTWIDQGAPNN